MDHRETLESVRDDIVKFVLENFPTDHTASTLPLHESLVERGIIDSMGVVELVEFLEKRWSIVIDESDITRDKMGGVIKMANLILEKLGNPPS